VNAFDI